MSRHTHRRTVLRLVALAVGMFGFGWAMIPLYSVFCEVIGIRSDDIRERTDASSIVTAGVDESRTVRVQFVAIKDEQMPWVFRPETFELKVHPGQRIDTTFFARNVLGQEMNGVVDDDSQLGRRDGRGGVCKVEWDRRDGRSSFESPGVLLQRAKELWPWYAGVCPLLHPILFADVP